MEEKLYANAELVRTVAKEQLGVDVGYDEAGVRWLDGYISRQHESASDELKAKLVNTLGSFLGECVRHTYGGQWTSEAQSGYWLVQLSPGNCLYPFSKVHKQLQNGADDSVLLFSLPSLRFSHQPRLRSRGGRSGNAGAVEPNPDD